MPERDPTRKLKELFSLAVELPRDQREAFLGRHCQGDPELERDLRGLLAEDDQGTASFLRKGAVPGATLGKRVDRYLLLSELGEGGMGMVYLAEQEEPVRRKVALKMVRAGMDTEQVVSRFGVERQALALMNHPAIANIYDGGATEAGLPYFVMEYVPGAPITRYSDQLRLTCDQRLRVFCRVCDGVQHAHNKGVIHRDLKPSNILVVAEDGEYQPKIIDFGIARALSGGLSRDASQRTQGAGIGTHRYMSPEQADSARDVDSRTDIYSLGVTLHELIVGRAPPESADGDLRNPSERLPTFPDASVIAGNRRTSVRGLVRRLTGDLDAILLRALQPERRLRYSSAAELKADILHYLAGEPVSVGPAGLAYRARKFVRRNRLLVLSGVLALFALVAAIAGTAIGKAQAEAARELESEMRRSAERQAERARALLQLMNHVALSSHTRADGEDRPVSLGDALTASLPAIGGICAGRPELEAFLRFDVGQLYTVLGEDERAHGLFVEAYQAQRQLLPAEDPDLLDALLALIHSTRLLEGSEPANLLLVRAFELADAIVRQRLPALGEPFHEMIALTSGPRPGAQAALARLDALLEALREHPDLPDRELWVVMRMVGEVGLVLRDRWDMAESRAYLATLADSTLALDPRGPAGLLLLLWGQTEAALVTGDERFEQAYRLADQLERGARGLPPRHWLRADAARLRGLALAGLGRLPEAEQEMLRAYDLAAGVSEVGERRRESRRGLFELCDFLHRSGQLGEFLHASLTSWRQDHSKNPQVSMWWVVRLPGNAPETYALAARAAADLLAVDGTARVLQTVQGMAHCRAGHSDRALALLDGAEADGPRSDPVGFVFRAMALHGTGEWGRARGLLERLETELTSPTEEVATYVEELRQQLGREAAGEPR